MEEIRRKMMQDPNLYPDLATINQQSKSTKPKPAASTVISISSESSDAPPIPRRGPVIISSDEDDDDDVVALPLKSHPPNAPRQAVPAKAGLSKPKVVAPAKATPIHVPSNRDLPTVMKRAPEPDYETFDLPPDDNTFEPRVSDAEAEKALRDLVTGVYTHNDVDVSPEDATVDGFREGFKLLPHQIVSRSWMADRESGKKTGGILADDMGLGKTIQTITRILEGRPFKKDQKDGWSAVTLVVCPVAVVSQWASEIRKIAIGLPVIEHHGPSRTSNPEDLERALVVITSYSTVSSEYGTFTPDSKNEGKSSKAKAKNAANYYSDDSNDSSVGRSLQAKRKTSKKQKDALFRVNWWRVVLDEAHNIKNRNTKAAQACCALEARFRWCLTGTPMQNNVEELYSLLKFLRVKPLNDWAKFNEQINKPVKANKPGRAMKRLQVVLRSIMLRRTKDTLVNGKPILDLPDRIVTTEDCDFDADERAFYNTVEARVNKSLDAMEKAGDMGKNYTSMLVLLLRMRQACNHPILVSENYKKDTDAMEPKAAKNDDDDDADDLADRLAGIGLSQTKRCEVCQAELPVSHKGDACTECVDLMAKARRRSSNPDLPPDSAKVRKTLEILQEIEERSEGTEKTIIFSQFTSMLDILEKFLKPEGIRYVRYDGSMNKAQREESLTAIKENKKIRVILISFKAGSTGLNLTCCNNVILVDLWWNPALEDQAFDRAHRFGQTRAVNIHKLCVPDTVEQRILELQEKKRMLAKAALSGDKLKNLRLGVDDLIALFRPGGHDEDDD